MREPLAPQPRLLAGPRNARLGPAIHAFNLPADGDICVAASPLCQAVCYAHSFLFQLQHRRHRRNFERSRQDDFPDAIQGEIRRAMIRFVRIHCSGDFYDAGYVRKWDRIARTCPGTRFFTYSRSWRHAAILDPLIDLARRPNVALWFSEDRDTGRPPDVPGFRRAYLLARGEDEGAVPGDADLVFRVPLPRDPGRPRSYQRPAKRANAVLICPKEQGVARQVELTCSTCRICFTDRDRRGGLRRSGEPMSSASPGG